MKNLSLLWSFLLDRYKLTLLIIIAILTFGFVSYIRLPREMTPTIDIPVANIMTIWPGASSQDVERLVTDKIETEIKNLDNVDKYSSVSLSGLSMVTVQFEVDSLKSDNMQKLREKINDAKKNLPDTILSDPEVNEVSVSDVPVLSLTLYGDFAWSELKDSAEKLEDEFKNIPQVKSVNINGAPEDKMHILVDPLKMQAQNVSLSEILQTIRASHRDLPLGQISTQGQKIEVSLSGQLEKPEDFMNLPLRNANGATIRLSDIAEVRREFDTFKVKTLFSKSENSSPAVYIEIVKSAAKGNVITMVDEALSRMETLRKNGDLPDNLKIDITFNRADEIKKSLSDVFVNGRDALILVAAIMFLTLGWRESVLSAISVPLTICISFIFMLMFGETFNGISLFALVLSIGMLVDDAIVIVDGIATNIHDKKMEFKEAAAAAIQTFRWPVLTGTLTTVFAFLPMLYFITGVSGQYIGVLPRTVSICLLASYFVALFLIPTIAIRFYKKFSPKKVQESKTFNRIKEWYGDFMKGILSSSKKTWGTIGLCVLLFVFSISLLATRRVLVEVFPSSDQVLFVIKAKFPEGTKLEETEKLIPAVEKTLQAYFKPQGPNKDVFLKSYVFTVGKTSNAVQRSNRTSAFEEENVLSVTANLTPKDSRKTRSYQIVPIIRKDMEKVVPEYVELTFSEQASGPPTGAPVEVRLTGTDLDHLEKLTDELKTEVAKIPGTQDVRDTRAERVTQMTWTIKRDELAYFGLTPVEIMESLRAAVNGVTVVSITEGDKEINVDLKVDWAQDKKWQEPQSLDFLNQIPIKTRAGNFITFQQVATPELSSELAQIDHRDGVRIMSVQSDLQKGVVASKLEPQIKKAIHNLKKNPGEIIAMGGDTEEGNRIMMEMLTAMGVAMFLIFVTLMWEFDSFVQSLIILGIIPLSLTFVFIGFWLIGLPVSMPTMIGIVALAGIIVKNAIVLIDRINHQEKGDEKLSLVDRCILGSKQRLRPIYLTSAATVIGLFPLSLSDEVWAGLGFAIIFGMSFSTILSLVLVPCFIVSFDRMKTWGKKKQ